MTQYIKHLHPKTTVITEYALDRAPSPVTGKAYHRTTEPVSFWFKDKHYHIKPGFITDLASIPECLQPLLPHNHPGIKLAAVVHDYLVKQYAKYYKDPSCNLTPHSMDKAFLQIMNSVDKLPVWKRYGAYGALLVNRFILIPLGKGYDYRPAIHS